MKGDLGCPGQGPCPLTGPLQPSGRPHPTAPCSWYPDTHSPVGTWAFCRHEDAMRGQPQVQGCSQKLLRGVRVCGSFIEYPTVTQRPQDEPLGRALACQLAAGHPLPTRWSHLMLPEQGSLHSLEELSHPRQQCGAKPIPSGGDAMSVCAIFSGQLSSPSPALPSAAPSSPALPVSATLWDHTGRLVNDGQEDGSAQHRACHMLEINLLSTGSEDIPCAPASPGSRPP